MAGSKGERGRMKEIEGNWKVGVTTGERTGEGRKVGSSEGRMRKGKKKRIRREGVRERWKMKASKKEVKVTGVWEQRLQGRRGD